MSEKVYYMIERNDRAQPEFWAGSCWLPLSERGVKFVRRQDAEAVLSAWAKPFVATVTEHMDVPPPGESGLSDDEANALLKKLSLHFNEPVMPVERYCKALYAWATVVCRRGYGSHIEPNRGEMGLPRSIREVQHAISKSSLLWRLIYNGEELRTRECPIHLGHWTGICFEEKRACPYGCEWTGWVPNDRPPFTERDSLIRDANFNLKHFPHVLDDRFSMDSFVVPVLNEHGISPGDPNDLSLRWTAWEFRRGESDDQVAFVSSLYPDRRVQTTVETLKRFLEGLDGAAKAARARIAELKADPE